MPPNNLPSRPSALIGREDELIACCELVPQTRLLTLTGMGGIGKTSLAIEVAAALFDRFPDGVWLVELGTITDPLEVALDVVSTVGVSSKQKDPVAALTAHLAGRRTLIVLDNCEHVAEACAALVVQLLSACPNLSVLATSRSPLRVEGEVVRSVPPLTVEDGLGGAGAVRLFTERAAVAQPGFAPEPHARAIISICEQLDGIPLAIELAAATVRILSPAEIEARLRTRLGVLEARPGRGPARQRTLRATMDWSHDLLTADERVVLSRISVFAADSSLEAVEQVCSGGGIHPDQVLGLIGGLVDASLLVPDVRPGDTRYRLLLPIRDYAREQLEVAGERAALRERHAAYFVRRAVEHAEPGLLGSQQTRWMALLEREHDDLREVFTWLRTGGGDAEAGLRLAGSLWRFWYLGGYIAEGRAEMEAALAAAPEVATAERARVLRGVGVLCRIQGDTAASRVYYEEALGLWRRLGDRLGVATALNSLGALARAEGDLERAAAQLEAGLEVFREVGDRRGVATAFNNLAQVARDQGDFETARRRAEEAVAGYREIDFREGIASALLNVGLATARLGRVERGRQILREALTAHRDLGYQEGVAEGLELVGLTAAMERRDQLAVCLLAAGGEMRRRLESPIPPSDATWIEETLAQLRTRLGRAAYDHAWAAGVKAPVDEAVELALGRRRVAEMGAFPGGLSGREVEVVKLLASGLRDRDIAEQLSISPRTVHKHIEHIRDKLDLQSRGQLGAWAVRAGLAEAPDAQE